MVALPALTDPNFDRTVVYILEHNTDGAFGVVLNRPSDEPPAEGLARWNLHLAAPQVLFTGGPVQQDAYIALAQLEDGTDNAAFAQLGNGFATVDLSVPPSELTELFRTVRIYHGYAGWGPGQLDGELDLDAWLVVPLVATDVFHPEPGELWRDVLRRQPGRISWLADFPDDISLN